MSTTPSSSPKPKPERSFSLTKIRASLRRSSKGASESSPEASEGRPSIDTPPTSPPATATTTPGSPTPAGSQRKPSSLRRMSLDVVRPNRHGRSGSVSMVPPADSATSSNGAVAASGAAPATNGSTEKGADFDPFSESHDDKSKPRGWRKTMKGALKRTTSRLSTSSAHSGGKPPSIENKEGAEVAPALESPPSTDSSTKQEETAPASKDVLEAAADTKPTEEVSNEEEKDEAKDETPAVPLEASTSLEWEHVDTKDADSPSVPVAPPAAEVTSPAEPEDAGEAKTLPPLNVSSRHMMHLRSEMAELSPIIESPITAVRDDSDAGLMIPAQHAAAKAPSPLRSAIEESYVEIPHLNEVAEAAENADVANASHRSGGPIVVDVTPATLKPTTSATSTSDVTASPALNAIELGNGVEGDKKPTATTPLLANRSTSTSSANPQQASDTQQENNASALGFVSNTAWFVGACVVLGIGMVVGQVRSYRQVQRRSSSAISSYFMTVKRWLRLA